MKTNVRPLGMILRSMGVLVILTAMFLLSSCTKTADENLSKGQQDDKDRNLEATAVEDKDLTESDEDLTTVDYKEFYELLSPHGEWVQVKPEEIGMQTKTAVSGSSGNNSFSLSNLLGIKDAYAKSDVSVGMVYVWKPSPELAVSSAVGVAPVYVPYTNGQWINTDAGWYFKANTPVEETTSHYGRWVNSPTAGWLWVPGRVWAPAWVDWRQNDTYVSWAPLPPAVYVVNNSMSVPVIDDNNYVIVERKYFLEPNVYKYNNVYYDNGDRILVSSMSVIPGIVVVNSTIINRGPDVNIFQALFGRTIELVNVQYVKNYKEVRYSEKVYYVYHPRFNRYKNKNKNKQWFTVNEPKSFKKYGDWKENKSYEKEYKKEVKEYNKELKKEEKEYKKQEKEIRKEIKKVDDGNMYDGKKKDRNRDGDVKGKKQDGNDKGKKNDGNDKGKKNDGNDGNKKNGNDDKKGKK